MKPESPVVLNNSTDNVSVGKSIQIALRVVESCDPALLAQLPFRTGFSNANRVKRARELAERLRLPSSQSESEGSQ